MPKSQLACLHMQHLSGAGWSGWPSGHFPSSTHAHAAVNNLPLPSGVTDANNEDNNALIIDITPSELKAPWQSTAAAHIEEDLDGFLTNFALDLSPLVMDLALLAVLGSSGSCSVDWALLSVALGMVSPFHCDTGLSVYCTPICDNFTSLVNIPL